jgi:hypothetical protein
MVGSSIQGKWRQFGEVGESRAGCACHMQLLTGASGAGLIFAPRVSSIPATRKP